MKLKEVYNKFPGYSEVDPSNQLPGGFLIKGSKNIDLTRKKGALAKRLGIEGQLSSVLDGAGVKGVHTYQRSSGDIALFGHGTSCYKLSGTESTLTKTTTADFEAGTVGATLNAAGDELALSVRMEATIQNIGSYNLVAYAPFSIGQVFTTNNDIALGGNITEINVRFGYGGPLGSLTLTLYDGPAKTTVLGVATNKPPNEYGWHVFEFDTPIITSPQTKYYFELTSNTGSISLKYGEKPLGNGGMYADGVLSPYSELLYTICCNGFDSGTWISPNYDLGSTPLTSALSWNATTPAGTSLVFKVRGSADSQNWGDWQNISEGGDGTPLTRYMQIQCELITDDVYITPSVQDFTITYTTSADTPTKIKENLTGNTLRYVDYEDVCYFAEGGRPQKYDGTTVLDVGVDPPASVASIAASATTGSPNGTYTAKVTFVNKYGAESNGSAASNSLTVSSKQINWSNIPVGPAGTTARKLYRTKAGGSVYYLVDTISDNTTTTYTDNVGDADMVSGILETDNDIPPDASIIHFHKSYMLYVVDDKIYFSKPNLPDSVPSDAYKKFPGKILGIKTYQDALIVGGKDFIVAVIGDIWDVDVAIDNTVRRFVSRTTGPINHEAMVECFTNQGDILAFPTEAGINYITPGLQENSLRSIPLSNRVQPIFDGAANKGNMAGVFQGGRLYLALNYSGTDTPVQTNNIIMVLDMRGSEWNWNPPWTIAASAFTLVDSDIYFGSPTVGQVFKLNAGTSDDGANIDAIAVLKTEYTALGVSAKKRLKELWLATEEASDTSALAVTVAVDGNSQVLTPGDFDEISTKQRIQLAKGYIFDIKVEDNSTKDWIITEIILKYKGKEKYGGS